VFVPHLHSPADSCFPVVCGASSADSAAHEDCCRPVHIVASVDHAAVSPRGSVQEAKDTFIELKSHCIILQCIARAANQKWLSRVDKARSCPLSCDPEGRCSLPESCGVGIAMAKGFLPLSHHSGHEVKPRQVRIWLSACVRVLPYT
jgi:hypothetical protein